MEKFVTAMDQERANIDFHSASSSSPQSLIREAARGSGAPVGPQLRGSSPPRCPAPACQAPEPVEVLHGDIMEWEDGLLEQTVETCTLKRRDAGHGPGGEREAQGPRGRVRERTRQRKTTGGNGRSKTRTSYCLMYVLVRQM